MHRGMGICWVAMSITLGERGVMFESPVEAVQIGFLSPPIFEDGQGIGDFNGDGFDDIALSFFNGTNRNGFPVYHVIVIHGRPAFFGRHQLAFDGTFPGSFVLRGPDPDGRYSVSNLRKVGDLDGDGISDLAFGHGQVSLVEGPGLGTGILVFGSPALEGEAHVEAIGRGIRGILFHSSDPAHQSIGFAITGIGDVNGDGDADLAISAPGSEPQGRIRAGIVFVLTETRDLPVTVDLAEVGRSVPGFVIEGINRPTRIGFTGSLGGGLQSAGDFNGDGFDDFFMTARELRPRTIYLFRGGPQIPPTVDLTRGEGLARTVSFIDSSGERLVGMPRQAAGVGDMNGDGIDDIAVSATRVSTSFLGPVLPSVVSILHGRPELPATVDFAALPAGLGTTIQGVQNTALDDYFGCSVDGAGDLDLDGVPDLLVGAARVGGKGEAYALFGKRDFGPEVFLDRGFEGMRITGETEKANLGITAASAGDFNGDGIPDILVLAPQFVQSQFPGAGRAYVIYGTGSGGPPITFLGLEPLWGPVRGGTTVRIRGSGFSGEVAVLFGEKHASDVTVISASEIRVTTPSGSTPGPVDVSTLVRGQARVRSDAFEYTPDFPEIRLDDLTGRGLVLDGRGELQLGGSMVFLDLNGDGADELVVEGRLEDRLNAMVVHGGEDLPAVLPAFEPAPRLTHIVSADRYGGSVGAIGDVNADGIEDLGLVLGTRAELGTGPVAFIVFGRRELPVRLTLEDEIETGGAVGLDRFGPRVARPFSAGIASAGDITGDGIADFAVSFPDGPVAPQTSAGEILFMAGRISWPSDLDLSSRDNLVARIHGSDADGLLGGQLLNVGDVNGDRADDFLATVETPSGLRGETAYIFYGGSDLPADIDARSHVEAGGGVMVRILLENSLPGQYRIAAPGDVDADGLGDVLIGIPGAWPDLTGASILIHGARDLPALLEVGKDPVGPEIARVVRVIGEDVTVAAGKVGPAGDFNEDGFADFLVGSSIRPPVEEISTPGRLFLLLGGESLPETIELRFLGSRGIRIDGIFEQSGFLITSANTGDLNADGSTDFGFRHADKVYVIHGQRVSRFVRGDVDDNGAIDITDAIFTLTFLFLGGRAPPCEDAADADDRGSVEITDAVYLLNYLFAGGPEPPPPHATAGEDPTADALACRRF